MNHYTTIIHIRCPFQPIWDYYEVELQCSNMVQCELFEACCDEVRGLEMTQERTADWIREAIRDRLPDLTFNLTVAGRHGANCRTVVKL